MKTKNLIFFSIFFLWLFVQEALAQDTIKKHNSAYIGLGFSTGLQFYNYSAINNDLRSAGFPTINSVQNPSSVIGIIGVRKFFFCEELLINHKQSTSDNSISTIYSTELIDYFGYRINKNRHFQLAPVIGFGSENLHLTGVNMSNNMQTSSLNSLKNNSSGFAIESQSITSLRIAFSANRFSKNQSSNFITAGFSLSAGYAYYFYQPWQTPSGQKISSIPFPIGNTFFVKLAMFL